MRLLRVVMPATGETCGARSPAPRRRRRGCRCHPSSSRPIGPITFPGGRPAASVSACMLYRTTELRSEIERLRGKRLV